MTYRAKVAKDVDCEHINAVNTAKFTYDSETETGDSDTDSATVKIKKPECDLPNSIPETGPVEIVLAIIIVLGITGGGFYFYRSRKTLNALKSQVASGDKTNQGPTTPTTPTTPQTPVQQ